MQGIEFTTPEIIITVGGMAVTFIGGVITGIRGWWNRKTKEQKAEIISDGIEAFKDGRLTGTELSDLIKEHL